MYPDHTDSDGSRGTIQHIYQTNYKRANSKIIYWLTSKPFIANITAKIIYTPSLFAHELLDLLFQNFWICTNKFIDLFPILEKHECGHGTDAVLLREVREFVNINFEVTRASIVLGKLVKFRCNHLDTLALLLKDQNDSANRTGITEIPSIARECTLQGPHHTA